MTNKLHKPLHHVTPCAKAKIIVRQNADIAARIWFKLQISNCRSHCITLTCNSLGNLFCNCDARQLVAQGWLQKSRWILHRAAQKPNFTVKTLKRNDYSLNFTKMKMQLNNMAKAWKWYWFMKLNWVSYIKISSSVDKIIHQLHKQIN